jgi:hypothetical protein
MTLPLPLTRVGCGFVLDDTQDIEATYIEFVQGMGNR